MLQVIPWLVANFTILYTQLSIVQHKMLHYVHRVYIDVHVHRCTCTSMYMYIIIIQAFDFYIYNFRPCCSDNIGIFDAAWDRGGMGSVALKDRQRYSTKHMHKYSTYMLSAACNNYELRSIVVCMWHARFS